MAVRLFIGNLPYDVSEAELRAHFAAVGPLLSLVLPTDRDTGKPRGFAFVEFSAQADAAEAIRRLHNQAFKGRLLAVNEARAREERGTTGPPRPAAKGAAKSERGPKRPMYKRATGPVRLGAEDDEGEAEGRGAYGARRHDTAVDYDPA